MESEESEESEEEKQDPVTVISKIVCTWLEQGTLIRFVDGNISNCAASNLQFVSLRDALNEVGNWKVDWDMNLTEFECGVVETFAPLLLEKYERERDGVKFFKIAPKTLSDHIACSRDDHPSHAPDEACPVCEALKSTATTCSEHLDMNNLFVYTYSSTERGPLSNTSFVLANVSFAAADDGNCVSVWASPFFSACLSSVQVSTVLTFSKPPPTVMWSHSTGLATAMAVHASCVDFISSWFSVTQ